MRSGYPHLSSSLRRNSSEHIRVTRVRDLARRKMTYQLHSRQFQIYPLLVLDVLVRVLVVTNVRVHTMNGVSVMQFVVQASSHSNRVTRQRNILQITIASFTFLLAHKCVRNKWPFGANMVSMRLFFFTIQIAFILFFIELIAHVLSKRIYR